MFSIRAVILDHYISNPIDELNVNEYSSDIKQFQEPVLRIYGSNADGFKSCVHIHGVFPYIYVQYEGGENPGRDSLLLGAALDEALAKANHNQKYCRYVYKVILTSKIPLYGYHSKPRQFFQIFFCNPYYIKKAMELLLSGAILGQKFQPYEAHIPYTLQFMIDYNIYGMSFVTFSKVKYRKNPENPDSLISIKTEDILSNKVKKNTCCYFEVDALAEDILSNINRGVVGVNPGLEAIWQEEKVRRRAHNKPSQVTIPSTVSGRYVYTSSSEVMYKEKLMKKLQEIPFEKPNAAVCMAEPKFLNTAKAPENNNPPESYTSSKEIENTQAENRSLEVGYLIDETILSHMVFNKKESEDSESEEEEGIEADSILGRNQNEEEEAEFEDDVGGDMTQPLDIEENMICDSDTNREEQGPSSAGNEDKFWEIMADRLFQFDGGQDSSSESDPEAAYNGQYRFSNSQLSIDTMLACCSPTSESISNWSNNIMPILTEDNACISSAVSHSPQTFWSNYSTKTDSSWLYDNSREPWTWNKNENYYENGISSKQKPENLCDFTMSSGEEFSKKKGPSEFYGNLFESDQIEFSEHPFDNIGPVYPISPPPSVLPPATNVDNYSDTSLHSVCKRVNDSLKFFSPSDDKTDTSKNLEKEGEHYPAVTLPKEHILDKVNQDKFLNVLNTFSSVDRKQKQQDRNGKTKPLTLKQYIRDCEEIVNIDFKNLSDREMVIIEYKPLNGKSSGNKFLIKPLDKFLKNWNSAEKKVNELVKGERADDYWSKTINKMEDSVMNKSAKEKNNLCGLVNSLGHKYAGDWLDPLKINSIKNKFLVKAGEISPDTKDKKTYKVNENVISQGKIKMKLTKSSGNELTKKSTYRGKTSKYFDCSKSRGTNGDVNANHISVYSCRNYLNRATNKLKKTLEEKNEKKAEHVFNLKSTGDTINIIELEEVCQKKKKKEMIKRKRSDVSDRFPRKMKKSQKSVNFTEFDSKVINKINSCFEEYYKNIVKINNFQTENNNNYYLGSDKDSEEEMEDDGKKFINSVMDKKGESDLNYSNLDPVKFVTRLLSSFSHMSQSSEIPPMSITISLGNGSNSPPAAIPIQLNLQPTVNVPTNLVKYFNKKHKRKVNFQNVDGPADTSSEESDDSTNGTSVLKKPKKDGFYKPLKLIAHNSELGGTDTGKKGKITRFRNKKNSEIIKSCSSSLEVCSVNFSKNSKLSSFLCEENTKRKSQCQEKGGFSEDLIDSKKNCREIIKFPSVTKSHQIQFSQGSTDSAAEPDFIYDSDKESQSKKLNLKQKNEMKRKRKTKVSKNFLHRIPQADVTLSTSEDETEIQFRNLFEPNRSSDPFTVLEVFKTNENSAKGVDILADSKFEFGEPSTRAVANLGDKEFAASSLIKDDSEMQWAGKNDEALSRMRVSSSSQCSPKCLISHNSEFSNQERTQKNQNHFSSIKSRSSELDLSSTNLESFRKVIAALSQTEMDYLVKEINSTLQPTSNNITEGFDSFSVDRPVVTPSNAQEITFSTNCKSVPELLGQSSRDVLSTKENSVLESNSSSLPANSRNVIFSQSSSMNSSKTLHVYPFSGITTIRGPKMIVPRKKPPKGNAVLSVLHEFEFFLSSDEIPFYSDPRDRFRAMETGPKIIKIESNSIVELKTFKSGLDLLGTEERRENILNYRMKGSRGTRHLFVADKCIKIIPLKKPPALSEVVSWIEPRNKQMNLENKFESAKTKILIPLSPENGSELDEEMDLSMTLSIPTEHAPEDKTSPSINISPSQNNSSGFESNRNLYPKPLIVSKTEELKKGPMSKIKGIKRLSSRGNLQVILEKSELQENLLIGNENICDNVLPKDSKQSSENSFQIGGITLNNTFGFDKSVENMQDIKLQQTHQNMSMLVIEVHILSRNDLRPDPRHDPVRALFYNVTFDDPEQNQETGIIVVGNKVLSDTGISIKTVHYVPTEMELIKRTIELTRIWDPDILAGYEIEMNSWGYLIQRGFVLERNMLYLLGRVQTGQSEDAPSKDTADFFSEFDEYYETPRNLRQMKVSGRIVLDIWRILRHEVALTSYTFENVMYHLTHERHPVFSHKMLSLYWEHINHRFRYITVEYYLTRVLGVVKLLDQLDFINRTSELSRLFGIQFYEVLSRGSQFRVESMMLRLAKPLHYIPTSPSVAQRAAMRAPASLPLILEPESNFYADPVIVLDFQSLYPSMIIAYNYCFSTCLGRVENLGGREPFEFGCTQLQISPEELKRLEKEITISPAGVAFVNSSIRKGVLPAMLEEILETRLMVKKSMKENKGHKRLEKLLFARQLGLKLIANVTYGYTAANFSGRMPCIEVGDSVVSKGRETLHRAIQLVKNTPKWGAKVVYGDTDSIFVLTPGKNRQEAFQVGAEIAEAVTQNNPKPVKLKLEKVYQPCILQTKKRYVGYMYENPEQLKPIFESKGIETVRRDGCPAVGKILQKALQILFDTRDVSLVKKYTVRQFSKLFQGRVNVQDLIFAKEYRGRKGYRPGACVPALQLAKQWTELDKRAEPRVKERVPYVIVNGPPGVPLIQCVRSPKDLISDPSLTISPVYYITKAIIPPMQRCFSLIGVDVMSWFLEMPRKYHKSYKINNAKRQKKSTISQYFSTTECIACSEFTNTQICQECQKQPQTLAVTLSQKIHRWERCYVNTLKICQSCCGRPSELECQSIDCPVFFRRNIVSRDMNQTQVLREIMHQYF